MNVSLPTHLEEFIRQQVAIGHYPTPDDVVLDALGLLKESQQAGQTEHDLARHIVQSRIAASDNAKLIPAKAVFNRLMKKATDRLAAWTGSAST